MKSWKIGAIAGLIAGFVAGIIIISIGIPDLLLSQISSKYAPYIIRPIEDIAAFEIILNMIWGIVLGAIYSRIYDLIPGKGISKGIIFAMIYWLIYGIRNTFLYISYAEPLFATAYILTGFVLIAYGFVLGTLYEFLQHRFYPIEEKMKALKYDIRGGIYPGAFAGIIQSIFVFILIFTIFNPELYSIYISDFGVLIDQFGTHIIFNMIWGIVFGMLFSLFFRKIPSEGILKGLTFGMTIYFITSFRNAIRFLAYGSIGLARLWAFSSFFGFLVFSIILGYLYKK